MIGTQFYLFKVRVDNESDSDTLQAVNRDGKAFDLDGLLDALGRIIANEHEDSKPDEGVLLQIIREPVRGVREDNTYALSYAEAAVLLEKHSVKREGEEVSDLDALVRATRAIEEANTSSAAGEV